MNVSATATIATREAATIAAVERKGEPTRPATVLRMVTELRPTATISSAKLFST